MLFQPGALSLGIVLPMSHRQPKTVDLGEQLRLARRADDLGFSALWVRDVPLNSDSYPDPVGHTDPWVLLGALATATSKINLITGAIVLPLRHPLHIAKAALSMDMLSQGRFVLGLGSGDRPSEFSLFERDFDQRKTLFREGWDRLSAALKGNVLDAQGNSHPSFELLPRRGSSPVPLLAVGSASQSLEWIARNAIGWATYHRDLDIQRDRIALWHTAVGKVTDEFRSFSQSMALDLASNPQAAAEPINLGYRTGRKALVDLLLSFRALGVHHMMFNIVENGRPTSDVLEELASEVLPAVR